MAQRNVTDGSSTSVSAGASIKRPSLETETLVRVPFSKSAISPCSQDFVSTAERGAKTHKKDKKTRKNDAKTREMCIKNRLFHRDPERIRPADHLVERNRNLLFCALC